MRNRVSIVLHWFLRTGGLLHMFLLLAAPAAEALQLVYPEPVSLVVSSRHLILKLGAGDITSVVVTINGVSSDSLPVGTPE